MQITQPQVGDHCCHRIGSVRDPSLPMMLNIAAPSPALIQSSTTLSKPNPFLPGGEGLVPYSFRRPSCITLALCIIHLYYNGGGGRGGSVMGEVFI
jgi:hypothetical protein